MVKSGKKWWIMFIGEYNHNMDTKCRIIMPSQFRDELGDTVCITKGMENCLLVYSKEEFHSLNIKNLGFARQEARYFKRIFYGGAKEMTFDKQGRILLPQHLIEHAKISKEVVIVGVTEHLEIWAKDQWDQFMELALPQYDDLLEKLTDSDM